DPEQAKATLEAFCKSLPELLRVEDWQRRPVHKIPNNAAHHPQPPPPQPVSRMAAAAPEAERDCWIDSVSLGLCVRDGLEIPCRLEYGEWDAASPFIKEVVLGQRAAPVPAR